MSRAEAATANDGDFGHDAVGDRIHHFGAGTDDAAPFGVFAYHKSIYIMKKDQRDTVLIAIEDEARGFFSGLRVNHAAELDALLIRTWRERPHMLLLIGDDADGPASDACISAEKRFAVFGAVLFKLAAIDDVILFGRFLGKNAVNLFGGEERLARRGMAEDRRVC